MVISYPVNRKRYRRNIIMKEEELLLLQDLTSRLSFGVMCEYKNETCSTTKPLLLTDICRVKTKTGFIYWDCYFEDNGGQDIPVEIVRPYLRPMSSMTDEEVKEIQKINWQFCKSVECFVGSEDDGYCSVSQMADILKYLRKHHFDYLGLIDLGMAIEVTEENNPYEKA